MRYGTFSASEDESCQMSAASQLSGTVYKCATHLRVPSPTSGGRLVHHRVTRWATEASRETLIVLPAK